MKKRGLFGRRPATIGHEELSSHDNHGAAHTKGAEGSSVTLANGNDLDEMKSVLDLVENAFDIRKKGSTVSKMSYTVSRRSRANVNDGQSTDGRRLAVSAKRFSQVSELDTESDEEMEDDREDATEADESLTSRLSDDHTDSSYSYGTNYTDDDTTSEAETAMASNTCAANLFSKRGRDQCGVFCAPPSMDDNDEQHDLASKEKEELAGEEKSTTIQDIAKCDLSRPFLLILETCENSYHKLYVYLSNVPQDVILSKKSSHSSLTMPSTMDTRSYVGR
jgi:hypothetical protein